MPPYNVNNLHTQNDLLMQNLTQFYQTPEHIQILMGIVNGDTHISLRIIDWFVTNYAKKNFTVYEIPSTNASSSIRFKVYNDYKLKLKAYSKKRFDPFQRWERIGIPYIHGGETGLFETTLGQLNFFKWIIEHHILDFIHENYATIETDMNTRNTSSKRRNCSEDSDETPTVDNAKTRKKREELSVSACKFIKKETVKILVKFS